MSSAPQVPSTATSVPLRPAHMGIPSCMSICPGRQRFAMWTMRMPERRAAPSARAARATTPLRATREELWVAFGPVAVGMSPVVLEIHERECRPTCLEFAGHLAPPRPRSRRRNGDGSWLLDDLIPTPAACVAPLDRSRPTFLAGDVGLAALGMLRNDPNAHDDWPLADRTRVRVSHPWSLSSRRASFERSFESTRTTSAGADLRC